MRRKIKDKIPRLIELTRGNPGKFTKIFLAHELDVSISTVHKYARELDLPTKEKATAFTDEQKEFVKKNHGVMGLSAIANHLGLKRYQVQAIGYKLGITFYVRRKQKVETEFFQHDEYYAKLW